MVPDKPVHQTTLPTKSQRNALDNNQAIGKACSNVMQRVLAMKTGAGCPIQFYHQTDLQNAGVLLALPALLSQGLLRYEHDFKLENVYYSSRSIFISLAILSLLRIKNLSKVDSLPPGELGRTIGLDRIPEVKT
jgi:hypothetical protein